jgi:hypothetical protein
MSIESELAAIEATDDTMAFVARALGIVVMQAKNSDKIIASWIYQREIKGTYPVEFERQQIVCTSSSRRYAIAHVLKAIKGLADIDLAVKFIHYREQLELVKDILGDNLIDEDE